MVNQVGTLHGGCAVSLIDKCVLFFLVVIIWASHFYPRRRRISPRPMSLLMLTGRRHLQLLLDGLDHARHARRQAQALQLGVSSAEHHLPCPCAAVSDQLLQYLLIAQAVPDPGFPPFSASDSGVKIEIVTATVSFGARTVSAVAEVSLPRSTLSIPLPAAPGLTASLHLCDKQIWDVTNGRLCMTGVHTKMAPSQPKL